MGRTPCCDKNGLKKGPWTPEEDMKLIQYIQIHGPHNWRILPKNAGLQRCGKSCRLRWTNYLRPDIKRGRFSFEEEETIIRLHCVLGNKWSAIAAHLPGRTDNEIKNYWNTRIRKRLLKMGIDPMTHAPRLNLLDLPSQLNLSSNLLLLQTLLNPEALTIALSLFPSNDDRPEFSLQKLKETPSFEFHDQPQNHQASAIFEPNQVDNVMGQETLSHLATSSLPCKPISTQANSGHFSMNSVSSCSQIFQDNMTATSFGDPNLPTNPSTSLDRSPDQKKGELSDNSSFMSVHLPSPACPNSASTFINGSTEDESESFCSNLLRFDISENLDLDYFM